MRAFTVSAIYASFSAKLYLEKWHNCAVLPNIYQINGFLNHLTDIVFDVTKTSLIV